MSCACASMARVASNGSSRPYARAVPGMNCAMPCAPAGERANGLKRDSWYSWAASSVPATLHRCAAREIAGANRTGTNACSVPVASPSSRPAPPKPTDAVPALSVKP